MDIRCGACISKRGGVKGTDSSNKMESVLIFIDLFYRYKYYGLEGREPPNCGPRTGKISGLAFTRLIARWRKAK